MCLSISNSELFRLVGKLLLAIGLVWALSLAVFYILDYMYFSSYGGNSGAQINYVVRTKYDSYIFGASRAAHHYDPAKISKVMGVSCYNAGDDGKNATYQLGLLNLLLKNHIPKYIIYELGDLIPLLDGGTVDLYPYYYRNRDVNEILDRRDEWSEVKFLQPLFPYNRKIFNITKGFILSAKPYETGFRPLTGTMHPAEQQRLMEQNRITTPDAVDSLALSDFIRFIQVCRKHNVSLILSYSPTFIPSKPTGLETLESLSKKYQLPILLYGEDPIFNNNPLLFKDAGHLNSIGADKFTAQLCKDLKKRHIK